MKRNQSDWIISGCFVNILTGRGTNDEAKHRDGNTLYIKKSGIPQVSALEVIIEW